MLIMHWTVHLNRKPKLSAVIARAQGKLVAGRSGLLENQHALTPAGASSERSDIEPAFPRLANARWKAHARRARLAQA